MNDQERNKKGDKYTHSYVSKPPGYGKKECEDGSIIVGSLKETSECIKSNIKQNFEQNSQ